MRRGETGVSPFAHTLQSVHERGSRGAGKGDKGAQLYCGEAGWSTSPEMAGGDAVRNDICILARSSQEMEGALAELTEICQEWESRGSERKSEVVAMGRANGEENGVLMG